MLSLDMVGGSRWMVQGMCLHGLDVSVVLLESSETRVLVICIE
jgi:hypothetical protein